MRADDIAAAAAILDAHEQWRSAGFADVLDDAAAASGEHRALVSLVADAVSGVSIYRMVAGAVGTAELECVAAQTADDERLLIRETVSRLSSERARMIVAEYPTTYTDFSARLRECGFTITGVAHDLIADGVGLEIAVLEPADLVTSG